MTIAEYINHLLSHEEYSFSWNEVLQNSTKTKTSLKRELSRLVEKKHVINLRKGFYLIITPRYKKMGFLPIELYIDKLCKFLEKNYYLAFYTAAKFHGASHQQIQKEYVITSLPAVHNISKDDIRINFSNTSNWVNKNIVQKKSDAGYYNVSSPALTMVDLIQYHTKLGGLNRMLAVIEELSEELEKSDVNKLLSWYPHKSTIQRLGFILEELQVKNEIVEKLEAFLHKNRIFPILLSPKKGQKAGKTGNKWKIDVNIELESDL